MADDDKLATLEARLREANQQRVAAAEAARKAKAELDAYRIRTGQRSTFEPPSEVTDEDRAAARRWDQRLLDVRALPDADRQALEALTADEQYALMMEHSDG